MREARIVPPATRIDPVYDTYFGTTIADPYRWMEDWKSDEMRGWLAEQSAYSRQVLDAIVERESLYHRVAALSGADAQVGNIQIIDNHLFYLRRDQQDTVPRLVRRSLTDPTEITLVDPTKLGVADSAEHTAIDWYSPSPDGQLIAVSISQGGSEAGTLHVLNVASGEYLPERIDRVLPIKLSLIRRGDVSWLPDSQSFIYHRLAELGPTAPESDYYNDSHTFLHRVTDTPDRDLAILGPGVNPRVALAREDFPLVSLPEGGHWAVATIIHGSLKEVTLYVAPAAALADPQTCPWQQIATVEDKVTAWAVDGDTIFLLTHHQARNSRVVGLSLHHPARERAIEIMPEGRAAIEDLRVAGPYLVTRELEAGLARMRRVRLHDGQPVGQPEEIAMPFDGTIVEWTGLSQTDQLLLVLTSWTVSPQVYRYEPSASQFIDTGYFPSSAIDYSSIESHEVLTPSWDGTLVPLSIVHRKGLRLDGQNPTLLNGYGAFGISLRPTYNPAMLAWLERGGVWAIAHIRGGGECGEEWYAAGRKHTKENTIQDYISCAEYLIRQGYTSPARLAGEGTSAGGIVSGGALVRRPELWSAIIMRVPVTNTLRIEWTENGPPNIPEYGSVTTEEGFRALMITDVYTAVEDGVAYPAVLVTTGLNDPRVVPWQPAKMVGRLQAATSSGQPVLLRVEWHGGHGVGATKEQLDSEFVDKLAFLFDRLGL